MNTSGGDLVIYGAWYFGQVVQEAARAAGWNVLGFVDPDPPADVATLAQIPGDAVAIVAIGDNALRSDIGSKLRAQGRVLATVLHPAASISPSSKIGAGVYVAEQAAVRTNAVLGVGVVIQAGAVVSHDCRIGDYASFGPNAVAASKVLVGERTGIGAGAVIAPALKIGDDCTVAAGAAVFKDAERGRSLVGNPGRSVVSPAKTVVKSDWESNSVW